jgi:RNA polymerase sigma factor (sigma-70 family)
MSDHELWRLACGGSVSAFELLVQRHQSMVCAVAYNACGNLALSEDVAQETFWTAWRERGSLRQADRLRSWLCGIARNLGRNAGRKAGRQAAGLASAAAIESAAPGPAEQAVSREEESLVWEALEAIPATYRETLVLFYREDQSVAEVAAALGLSDEAVRQRLARGRAMLRERVAGLVESGLRRSRPGRSLTLAVMSGLAAGAAAAKPAVAAAGAAGAGAGAGVGAGAAAAAKAVGAGVAGGTVGGLLGAAFGLFGGWLGTWVPAQLAPTQRERDHYLRTGRRMLAVSVLFLVGMVLLVQVRGLAGRPGYLAAWLAWFVAFQAYVAVE